MINRPRFGVVKGCLVLLMIAVALALGSCQSSNRHPAASLDLSDHKSFRLKNGLEVMVFPDDRLPYLTLDLLIRSGASSDPTDRAGVAGMTGALLNKGTAQRTAVEIAESLETAGASLGVSVSSDYMMVNLKALEFERESAVRDFADVVMRPSFPTAEFEQEKRRILGLMQRQQDEPSAVVGRAFREMNYPSAHPYFRSINGSSASVKKIKKRDIIQFYLKHFRPNNALLAVSGRVNTSQLKQELEELMADWEPRDVPEVSFPKIRVEDQMTELHLVDRADLKQTQVLVGHLGPKRKIPEHVALQMSMQILGGGFSSRLFKEVRIRRGLSYGVAAHANGAMAEGLFLVSAATRHEKAQELVQSILDELHKFHREACTPEELNLARAFLQGQFAWALETPEDRAGQVLTLKLYGLGLDYLESYFTEVGLMSCSQIQEAVSKYLRPESLQIVVYAPQAQVSAQLSRIKGVVVRRHSYKDFIH